MSQNNINNQNNFQNSYSSPVRARQQQQQQQMPGQYQQQQQIPQQNYNPQQQQQSQQYQKNPASQPQSSQQINNQQSPQYTQQPVQQGYYSQLGQSQAKNISPNRNAISRLQQSNGGWNRNLDGSQPQNNPRIVYLRQLYFTLTVQLVLVGVLALLVALIEDLKTHFVENPVYFWVGISIAAIIALFGLCYREKIRRSPVNIILLVLWTISAGVTAVYALSVWGDATVGLMVFVMFTSIVFSQFIYTLTVRYELTIQGATLFIFGAVLLVYQSYALFSNLSFYQLAGVSFFGILFAFYLVFDTQSRIAAPDYDYNQEEYKSGAVLVYLDVFLLTLRISDLLKTSIVKRDI